MFLNAVSSSGLYLYVCLREGEADVFAMEEQACGLKKEASSATSSVSNLTEDSPAPAPTKQQEVYSLRNSSVYWKEL